MVQKGNRQCINKLKNEEIRRDFNKEVNKLLQKIRVQLKKNGKIKEFNDKCNRESS